jgi:hypothetical protein
VLLLDLVESWYNTDMEARGPANARISEIGLVVWWARRSAHGA